MKKLPVVIIIFTLFVASLIGCSITDSEPKKNSDDIQILQVTATPIEVAGKELKESSIEILPTEIPATVPSALTTAEVETAINNQTREPNTLLRVHYIDVGQADSILVQSPNGKVMLIDAGNNSDGDDVVKYLRSQGVAKIDTLVGTHPHEDHIGGIDSVINAFDIGKIYMPKASSNTKTFEDVLNAVKNKDLKITTAAAGISIGLDSDVKAEIIAPNVSSYEELNNYSAVIKLTYNNTSFLFTGDAESISEQEMMSKGYNLKSDVLKVGHHGSGSSTTAAFLKKVSPKYAVISVGKDNDYGHPDSLILNRLKIQGVEVFRTDEAGTITAISDGNTIKLNKKASAIKENALPAKSPIPTPTATVIKENTEAKADAQPGMIYIGNKNSKKFHKDSCSSLPYPKNQVIFNSREEAIKAGHEPCKRCNP